MRFLTLAAFIVFTAFCIIVGVSNRSDVFFSLHPLPFSWDMPLYLLLFIGIFIGGGAAAFVAGIKSLTLIQQIRRQARKIRDLEKQISDANQTLNPSDQTSPPE